MLVIEKQVILNRLPRRHIVKVRLQNRKKSAVNHSIEKPMLLNFVHLSRKVLSKMFEKIYFHFWLDPDPM